MSGYLRKSQRPSVVARAKFYSPTDASIIIGVSTPTLMKLADRGKLKFYPAPSAAEIPRRHFKHEDVMAYMEERGLGDVARERIHDPSGRLAAEVCE